MFFLRIPTRVLDAHGMDSSRIAAYQKITSVSIAQDPLNNGVIRTIKISDTVRALNISTNYTLRMPLQGLTITTHLLPTLSSL